MSGFFKGEVAARVLPFALFMAFIGLEEGGRFLIGKGWLAIPEHVLYYMYPVKAVSVAIMLLIFRKKYEEIRLPQLRDLHMLVIGIFVGIAVFMLWVRMDWSVGVQGNPTGFNPMVFQDATVRIIMTVTRIAGAVLVVPIMEELFWRSFLLRYIIDNNFLAVPLGSFTWPSFLVSVVLFGMEHHLFLAGMMAAVAYNLLLYYSRSIAHCIVAHALTNLALATYVVYTGKWYFW